MNLQNSMLFRGMNEDEITLALQMLFAQEKEYQKGGIILHAGDTTELMGMVISGSVTIESNDMWGNRAILSNAGQGQFFAETYAWLSDEPMLVDVVANENCRILFLKISVLKKSLSSNVSNVSNESNDAISWRPKLMKNLLAISSHKNLMLSERNFHTSPKTIRGRVMSYLNSVSLQKAAKEFDIPFDRQQLAGYLAVERTALSKELGKMQDDGLIQYRLNHFVLNDMPFGS